MKDHLNHLVAAPGLPDEAAAAILDAYDFYQAEFKRITRKAKSTFEHRDGLGAHQDAVERLELYKKVVQAVTAALRQLMGDKIHNRDTWSRMKTEYSSRITGRNDLELAETFFNSITRRVFTTIGVDPNIEFVNTGFVYPLDHRRPPIYSTYKPENPASQAAIQELIQQILSEVPFDVPYQDLERDAYLAAAKICSHLLSRRGSAWMDRIEILHPVFYRSNLAYRVGRVCLQAGTESQRIPLILCLINTDAGVVLDAVLLNEDDVSIVFSFTRSYFHVETQQPHALIRFLKDIMPLKRIAELYISIGYNKHGKTELYRDLLRHLAGSSDQFKIARGERGMVMLVFSLDSYDLVFKVIKDKVDYPKTTSRKEVMERYDLVFRHDRAGRLVDAQEYEYLSFDRSRFSEELLAELAAVAPDTISIGEDCVIVKHLYIERRMTPLNLFVKEAGEEASRQAVIDYGQAIKDLAATNIFPGDILLKNFGVTRHGRVVFYDYDELCLLTDCKFRRMPQPRDFDEAFENEPWFYVGPYDIFPEEFQTFLGLQGTLRSLFIAHHADLFDTAFWRSMLSRHLAGEVVDIFPYPESRRLFCPPTP